jgi:hypothetical protein
MGRPGICGGKKQRFLRARRWRCGALRHDSQRQCTLTAADLAMELMHGMGGVSATKVPDKSAVLIDRRAANSGHSADA